MSVCKECKFALDTDELDQIMYVLPYFPEGYYFCLMKFKSFTDMLPGQFPRGVVAAVEEYVPVPPDGETCEHFISDK